MKLNHYLNLSLLVLLLYGCGQTGPLYLPKDNPPVTVAPKPKESVKEENKTTVNTKIKTKVIQETPPDLTEEN